MMQNENDRSQKQAQLEKKKKKNLPIFYRYLNTDNIFRDFIPRTAIISSYWADRSPTGQNILFYLGMKLIKWRLLLQAFTN